MFGGCHACSAHPRSASFAFMNRYVLLTSGKKHFILNVLLLACRQLCTRDCPLKEVPSITEAEPSSNCFWTETFLVPYFVLPMLVLNYNKRIMWVLPSVSH
jgi:hypothetical protein